MTPQAEYQSDIDDAKFKIAFGSVLLLVPTVLLVAGIVAVHVPFTKDGTALVMILYAFLVVMYGYTIATNMQHITDAKYRMQREKELA